MSIPEIGKEIDHRGIERAKKNGYNFFLCGRKKRPTKEAMLKHIKKREVLVNLLVGLAG